MASIKISDNSFEKEVLKSENLTLVDFWAEWCGPCKMIGPALEEISEEMKDDVRITKLNICICGSLYLAGEFLKNNQTIPN